MMRAIILFILTGLFVGCEKSTFPISVHQEPSSAPQKFSLDSLFDRAQRSELVIVATLIKSSPIAKKFSGKELTDVRDLGKTLGGVLHTFNVNQIVCFNKHNVRPGSTSLIGKEIALFRKREDSFQGDILDRKNDYFIFINHKEGLPNEFDLPNNQNYFELNDIDSVWLLSGKDAKKRQALVSKLEKQCK